VKPRLQSLIVADRVFHDRDLRKFVIAGTFNTLTVRQSSPDQGNVSMESRSQAERKSINALRAAGNPWLYFSLTDIVGKVLSSIRFVFLRDNQVLFSTDEFTIESNDRLATHERRLELPQLPMVGLGPYAIEFFANGEMIGALRIMAVADASETGEHQA
jgi:hypothetical protein